jgi:tetratricopeptide (TPR) repeat protein
MKVMIRLLTVLAVTFALLVSTGCGKLRARDQLNKGVQSYKNSKYEEAIEHFKNAVAYDPTLLNAQLYLATAYASQYIPGVESPDNIRMGDQAIEEYKKVLDVAIATREQKVNGVKGIAYIYLNMKKFDQAREYYLKATELDPKDAEPFYSVGVIDWTKAYQPRQEERGKLGLKPNDQLKDKKVCAMLRAKNWDVVADGMAMLDKAINLREEYDDAMAYMNLMYRERADIQCDDPAAYQADMQAADDWVDKTMAAKKSKAEKAAHAPGGIVMDAPKQ